MISEFVFSHGLHLLKKLISCNIITISLPNTPTLGLWIEISTAIK